MPERITRTRTPDRELIHLLNQRYHRAWVRAELLQNELAGLRASRAGRIVSWVQRLKERFWPAAAPDEPPLAERATPYVAPESPPEPRGFVSIVIPFRDQPELLRNCLRCLRASTYRDFEVILVDNGSTDPRTRRLLARARRGLRGRRVRVVEDRGPFNFAHLCNAGAARATGDFFLFLNNDTEVIAPNWLEHLLRIGADPRVGAVGATLLYPDRTIQHAGLLPRADGLWVHPYRGLPADHPGDGDELRAARCVPAVTAACLLVRRDRFSSLCGFDEQFPVAYNDVDLCARLRDRGLLVVVSPDARLFHYEGLTRGFAVDRP